MGCFHVGVSRSTYIFIFFFSFFIPSRYNKSVVGHKVRFLFLHHECYLRCATALQNLGKHITFVRSSSDRKIKKKKKNPSALKKRDLQSGLNGSISFPFFFPSSSFFFFFFFSPCFCYQIIISRKN